MAKKPLKATWETKDIFKVFFWLLVWLILLYPLNLVLDELFPGMKITWNSLINNYIIYLVILFMVWLYAVRKSPQRWKAVGLRSFRIRNAILLAIIGFFLSKAVTIAYTYLVQEFFGYLPANDIFPDITELFGIGFFGFMLAILSLGVFFPIIEEIFFRGFIYTVLRKRFGVLFGVLLSSMIFGIFHIHPWLIFPITIMGIFLASFYELTGSLGGSIFFHSLNNIVSVVTLYIVEFYGG